MLLSPMGSLKLTLARSLVPSDSDTRQAGDHLVEVSLVYDVVVGA